MSILTNPNPANIFLSMYDTCIVTDNEEFCKQYIASASPPLVNAYLSVYSACRKVAGPELCRNMMAPKSSPAPIVIGIGIGLILGLVLKWLRQRI